MFYRTRTYIAADWDHDRDVVDKLLEWNQSSNCSLEFSYAHDLMQARDESLYCSIKKSLRERLNGSKTFVLIAGAETTRVTKGGSLLGEFHEQRSLVGYSPFSYQESDITEQLTLFFFNLFILVGG